MVGSREEMHNVVRLRQLVPKVINGVEEMRTENKKQLLLKAAKIIQDYKVKILNQPRPGKKLLVLDIDNIILGNILIFDRNNRRNRKILCVEVAWMIFLFECQPTTSSSSI